MPQDDYFKIVYQILKELYQSMKDGERVNPIHISDTRFDIPYGCWVKNGLTTKIFRTDCGKTKPD